MDITLTLNSETSARQPNVCASIGAARVEYARMVIMSSYDVLPAGQLPRVAVSFASSEVPFLMSRA